MSRVLAPPHWSHQHQHHSNSHSQSLDPSAYLYDDDEEEPLTLMRSNYGTITQTTQHSHSQSHTPQSNHRNPGRQSVNRTSKQISSQSFSPESSRAINQSSSQITDQTPLLLDRSPLSSIKELDPANNQSNTPSSNQSIKNPIRLIVYVVLAVLVTVANAITWKRTLNRFKSSHHSHNQSDEESDERQPVNESKNFEFFVTQLTIFLYVLLAGMCLAYKWWFTDDISQEQKEAWLGRSSSQSNNDLSDIEDLSLGQSAYHSNTSSSPVNNKAVNETQKQSNGQSNDQSLDSPVNESNPLSYLHFKLLGMGLCDSFAGICSALGGAFSTGQVQTVINQFNIPLTLLMGRLLLKNACSRNQLVGAGLIMLGSGIGSMHSSEASSSTIWFGPLLLLVSCVPNSASNILKEWSFRAANLDVFLMTTSVSLYQVVLGFLFVPFLGFSAFGGVPITEIASHFGEGWSCFKGDHVEGFECHISPSPWVILMIYVFVNFGLNVLLLLITKHGSALLLVISSALSLPFTNVMFTSPLIMGKEAETWSWMNAFGLTIVVIGFLIYSLMTDENGEFMPAQGAAGQMMYVTEAPPVSRAHLKRRRHSFDATRSPLIIADAARRKKEAMEKFHSSRAKASAHR